MNTRVRYTKKEHMLVTTDEMLGRDHILNVEIDTNTMNFKVLSKEGEVIARGLDKTLPKVKLLVKATLRGLGVQFHDEVRNSKVVVVEKDEQ